MRCGFPGNICPSAQHPWQFLTCEGQTCSLVLRLDMVDKSTSLSKPTSGWMFVIEQSGQAFPSQSEAPSESCCWDIQQPPRDMILYSHLASMPLKGKPLALGKRAPPEPSNFGWFFPLPWLAYAAGSVEPEGCHLVFEAARVLLAAPHEVGQNESTPATTPDGQEAAKPVGTWPRCGVRALSSRDERSDSPAQ